MFVGVWRHMGFLRGRVLGNRLGISYYWLPPPPERVKVLAMTGVEVVCNNVFPLKLVLSKICFNCSVNASASLWKASLDFSSYMPLADWTDKSLKRARMSDMLARAPSAVWSKDIPSEMFFIACWEPRSWAVIVDERKRPAALSAAQFTL